MFNLRVYLPFSVENAALPPQNSTRPAWASSVREISAAPGSSEKPAATADAATTVSAGEIPPHAELVKSRAAGYQGWGSSVRRTSKRLFCHLRELTINLFKP